MTPRATSSWRARPGRIGSPAASALVHPAGRSRLERRSKTRPGPRVPGASAALGGEELVQAAGVAVEQQHVAVGAALDARRGRNRVADAVGFAGVVERHRPPRGGPGDDVDRDAVAPPVAEVRVEAVVEADRAHQPRRVGMARQRVDRRVPDVARGQDRAARCPGQRRGGRRGAGEGGECRGGEGAGEPAHPLSIGSGGRYDDPPRRRYRRYRRPAAIPRALARPRRRAGLPRARGAGLHGRRPRAAARLDQPRGPRVRARRDLRRCPPLVTACHGLDRAGRPAAGDRRVLPPPAGAGVRDAVPGVGRHLRPRGEHLHRRRAVRAAGADRRLPRLGVRPRARRAWTPWRAPARWRAS